MTPRDDDPPDDDDDLPPARTFVLRLTHAHDCANGCGATLHCPDHDRCRVRGPWTCPSCEDYIEEQQAIALAKTLGKD
jgi:hypothetical protein